jgi:hypothetical protein
VYLAVSSPECKSESWHKIANRLFENVSQLKHFGMTVTNQNLIEEEMKRRFNSGNVSCYSVQKLPSFHVLSKNKN